MASGNLPHLSRRVLGYAVLAVALVILVVPYMIFPQFFIPKENASAGYVAPASIEGWAIMGIGIALIIVSIVLLKTAAINR
ncbi:MAG: hypothetical protein ACQCN4_08320 [Candidatus Bathyarchaeia archaeon]|jgi:amino acid transporter